MAYGYGSMDSTYGSAYSQTFTGYRLAAGRMGTTTDPRTANQLAEVAAKLSEGMKVVEAGSMTPQIFQSIPKEHFKEIERLAKLAGAEVTMHAPIQGIDPAGFNQQGVWDEAERLQAERSFNSVVDRAHEMNPKGNVPITIHASMLGAYEWASPEKAESIVIVDKMTGKPTQMQREVRWEPTLEGPERKEHTPEQMLKIHNGTAWSNQLSNLQVYKKSADELFREGFQTVDTVWKDYNEGKISDKDLSPGQKMGMDLIDRGEIFYNDLDANFRGLYNEAMRFLPENAEQKRAVMDILNKVGKQYGEMNKMREEIRGEIPPPSKTMIYDSMIKELSRLGTAPLLDKSGRMYVEVVNGERKVVRIQTPERFVKIEDFSRVHAAETLSNVAMHGYNKYGENAPIISIENITPNMAFSRAESLKGLVQESRKQFVEQAVKQGKSRGEAEKIAAKMIGATWDTSHIGMLRKYGYSKEDIVKETAKIAPFVKHVHLNDNFGYEHSDLPPGMGDTPLKEMMGKLEEAGYKGKNILEVGNFVSQFKTSAFPYSLEAMGSPVYSAGPVWGQARSAAGAYFSGYGPTFPEQHFSMYGSGFSSLPLELGSSMPGKTSKFSGTPMA